MPRRSPGSIIFPTLAGVALAVALAEPASAQRLASASIGVRAVIAPSVTGATASELVDPTARIAITPVATPGTAAADSRIPLRATVDGAPAGTPGVQRPARSEGSEPRRYRAVVRLDGVDGAASVALRVRDAEGRTRDLAREAAVLVSDAPAVEVRRALARLLASTAGRPPRAASSATTDDAQAGVAAGTTVRLTLELTPSTMLAQ